MLMMDNFIHADLHPGNVLVRMEEADWIARVQRYLLIGQWGARVPHIVFLDAGLAANFDERIYSNVQNFFDAIIKFDGPRFGRAILGLAPEQPHVASPSAFVGEVAVKMKEMRQQMEDGEGRAGRMLGFNGDNAILEGTAGGRQGSMGAAPSGRVQPEHGRARGQGHVEPAARQPR